MIKGKRSELIDRQPAYRVILNEQPQKVEVFVPRSPLVWLLNPLKNEGPEEYVAKEDG